jgi:hypothetical protein
MNSGAAFSYSTILSALASSVAGTVIPGIFAVLRLIDNSNLELW